MPPHSVGGEGGRLFKDARQKLPSLAAKDESALLIDVAVQVLRDELADYEDFCRFCQVAADFSQIAKSAQASPI